MLHDRNVTAMKGTTKPASARWRMGAHCGTSVYIVVQILCRELIAINFLIDMKCMYACTHESSTCLI